MLWEGWSFPPQIFIHQHTALAPLGKNISRVGVLPITRTNEMLHPCYSPGFLVFYLAYPAQCEIKVRPIKYLLGITKKHCIQNA